MGSLTGYIGRKTLKFVNYVLDLLAFTYKLVGLSFNFPHTGRVLAGRIIVEQIYFTAVQALPVLIPISLITGSMIIIQLSMLSGQVDLGKIAVLLILREIGPMLTAIIVILRSATAVTIEISYMKVLHEIDALEMSGIDPMIVVCYPRFIGITSAILSLYVVFGMFAITGGWFIAWVGAYFPVGGFFQQIAKAVSVADIAVGLIKAFCFGVAITVTCLYHGFEYKEQITQVPVATSRSSIECFLFCLIVNILISVVFYL